MRIIDIEFTEPKNHPLPIFSWAIKAIQKTKYSHVRFKWQNSFGRALVYEASGSSVKFRGDISLKASPVIVHKTFRLELTDEEFSRFSDQCGMFADVKYSVRQAAGIAVAQALGLKKNPFSRGASAQICSELTARILLHVKNWHLVSSEIDMAGPLEVEKALRIKADHYECLTLLS